MKWICLTVLITAVGLRTASTASLPPLKSPRLDEQSMSPRSVPRRTRTLYGQTSWARSAAQHKSIALQNMFKPTKNKYFRSIKKGAIALNIKDWVRMGRIEKSLTKGKRVRLGRRSRAFRDWKMLKRAMKWEWAKEKCWTGFNPRTDQWISCCLLLSLKPRKNVGFCGSHEALHLPNLCRPPIPGFDFKSSKGSKVRTAPKPKDSYNSGAWDCPGLPSKADKSTDVKVVNDEDGQATGDVSRSASDFQEKGIQAPLRPRVRTGDDEWANEQFIVYHIDDENTTNPCDHVVQEEDYFAMPCFAAW